MLTKYVSQLTQMLKIIIIKMDCTQMHTRKPALTFQLLIYADIQDFFTMNLIYKPNLYTLLFLISYYFFM